MEWRIEACINKFLKINKIPSWAPRAWLKAASGTTPCVKEKGLWRVCL